MIEHIEQLFTESKTVIIPGLGALTITNPDTKEVMFMPYLKHDDGALSGFMAAKLGVSEDEAKAKIASEVTTILSELDAGKKPSLGNFGHFTKDGDDVVFENSGSGDAASKPEAKPEKEPIKEEKTAPKAEEKPKAEKKPVPKKEVKKEEKTTEAKPKKETKATAKPKAVSKTKPTKAATEKPKDTPAKAAPKNEAKAEAKPKAPAKPKTTAKKETPAAEAKKAAPVKKEKTPEKPKKASSTEAKPETKKTAAKASAAKVASTAIPADKKEKAPKKDMNILEKKEIAANEQKLEKLKKQKEEGKKKKKRGVGFYILIFVVFLIAGGGTFVALNYDNMGDYLPFLAENKVEDKGDEEVDKMKEMASNDEEDSTSDEEIAEEPDTTSMEEIPTEIEEPIVEDPVETPVEPTPPVTNTGSNNQPFHIVAGVFGDPGNAERLAEKIRGMGYPATTFMRGNQTVVSIKSFATKAEAQAAIPGTSDAAPKGWVLEWR